jgi:hypothetical protein
MTALNEDQFLWVQTLARLRAQRKHLEVQEKEAVAMLRVFGAGADMLTHNGSPVVFDRQTSQTRIDVALLRTLHPGVAEECTTVSSVRRLTIAEGVA